MDRDQAIKLMQELLKRVVERAASDMFITAANNAAPAAQRANNLAFMLVSQPSQLRRAFDNPATAQLISRVSQRPCPSRVV